MCGGNEIEGIRRRGDHIGKIRSLGEGQGPAQFLKNSSMAELESNEEVDLSDDEEEIEEEVDELNEDETTLLLVTELTMDDEDWSDDDRAPLSETISETLRSEANADSDFSCFLVIELAVSSTIDFSLAEP